MKSTTFATGDAVEDRRFDPERVTLLRGLSLEGEVDIFALTAQIFLDTVPGALAALRQGVARRDGGATQRAAHSLRGSAASLGAAGLARACAELEATSKAAVTAASVAALARVEDELALARTWLAEQLA